MSRRSRLPPIRTVILAVVVLAGSVDAGPAAGAGGRDTLTHQFPLGTQTITGSHPPSVRTTTSSSATSAPASAASAGSAQTRTAHHRGGGVSIVVWAGAVLAAAVLLLLGRVAGPAVARRRSEQVPRTLRPPPVQHRRSERR